LQAASDADAVRWVGRDEWIRPDALLNALELDPITVRVIEAGWQKAQAISEEEREGR
jgi:hypothetical protein